MVPSVIVALVCAGVAAAALAAQRKAESGPGQRGEPCACRLRAEHGHLLGKDQEPVP